MQWDKNNNKSVTESYHGSIYVQVFQTLANLTQKQNIKQKHRYSVILET